MHAGEWRTELTTSIPRDQLPPDSVFKKGDSVRLSNGASAVVQEMSSDALQLDFNPPLAGKDLTFEVELLNVTKVGNALQILVSLPQCHLAIASSAFSEGWAYAARRLHICNMPPLEQDVSGGQNCSSSASLGLWPQKLGTARVR